MIKNRQENPLPAGEYGEKHHIIPKSLGGSDDKINIVKLTSREHFVGHLLLFKMQPVNSPAWHSMCKAFTMMKSASGNQNRYFNSRSYQIAAKHKSKVMSESQSGTKNSQYGTMPIFRFNPEDTDDREMKKIPRTDPVPEGWHKGNLQTKIKPCETCGKFMIKPGKKKYCNDGCRNVKIKRSKLDGKEKAFLEKYDKNGNSMNAAMIAIGISYGAKGDMYNWAKNVLDNRENYDS